VDWKAPLKSQSEGQERGECGALAYVKLTFPSRTGDGHPHGGDTYAWQVSFDFFSVRFLIKPKGQSGNREYLETFTGIPSNDAEFCRGIPIRRM
jgi:hypothetical protein